MGMCDPPITINAPGAIVVEFPGPETSGSGVSSLRGRTFATTTHVHAALSGAPLGALSFHAKDVWSCLKTWNDGTPAR
jgi:hypothetical protein